VKISEDDNDFTKNKKLLLADTNYSRHRFSSDVARHFSILLEAVLS
jgi:hypothetical protein